MKRVFFLALLCLLAALLCGCGAEPAPIWLTPLGEAAAPADTVETGRVTIRAAGRDARPAALPEPEPSAAPDEARLYVLNTNSKRFHDPACQSVTEMKPANRQDITASREELLAQGYVPCGRCKP